MFDMYISLFSYFIYTPKWYLCMYTSFFFFSTLKRNLYQKLSGIFVQEERGGEQPVSATLIIGAT